MAAVTDAVRTAVAAALGARVTGATAVGGGCISPAWRAALEGGGVVFVKESETPGLLREEAFSLRTLRAACVGDELQVPQVLAAGDGWLALEWLDATENASAAAWARAGRGLARLHRVRGAGWGWPQDNFIGPLPQANGWGDDWAAFWRDQRLRPQAAAAASQLGAGAARQLDALNARLEEILAPAADEGASLLHGDLWRGNLIMTAGGAALVDPASCYGHREVDLAMAALFGGFPQEFFGEYAAEWPLLAGAERRRSVYQLYYLLVHVNLFGGSYVAEVERALRAALD